MLRRRYALAALVAALTIATSAHAASTSVKLLTMIPVPGEPIESYHIGIVNEKSHLYYQTDRSDKSTDVFDVSKNTFVSRVPGFVGFTGNRNTSGGNGGGLVNIVAELWSGDGDGTVKVIDLKSGEIIDTISTGGKKRANETDVDPVDQIFIGCNAGSSDSKIPRSPPCSISLARGWSPRRPRWVAPTWPAMWRSSGSMWSARLHGQTTISVYSCAIGDRIPTMVDATACAQQRLRFKLSSRRPCRDLGNVA